MVIYPKFTVTEITLMKPFDLFPQVVKINAIDNNFS